MSNQVLLLYSMLRVMCAYFASISLKWIVEICNVTKYQQRELRRGRQTCSMPNDDVKVGPSSYTRYVHTLDAKPLVERDFQFGTAQKLIKATK